MDSMWPNWTVYHKGFFRKLFVDQLKRKSKIELTKEQEAAIEKEYSDHSQRMTGRTAPNNIQNVIFILVESLSSYPINKSFGGVEITPNINRLLPTAYYNPNMESQAVLGESSDGQFIYLTGLLPLKSGVTINEIKADSITTFVSLAKQQMPRLYSQMTIPTSR